MFSFHFSFIITYSAPNLKSPIKTIQKFSKFMKFRFGITVHFFDLISKNYLLDLENPTITTQFQPETTKSSSSYSSNHKDHQNMFQTTSPFGFDCTKYPYGCCPEDPFPNMVNGGCSPDCLCNPLGTFNFYIHSQCQCCQLWLLICLPA